MHWFLSLMLFLLYAAINGSKAEENCANSYENIDQECVENFSQKMGPASFALAKIGIDQVLFYRTSEGNLGKLKIIGREVTPGECSLYWESETFSQPNSYKTNTNLTIDNKVGMWSSKDINLDFKTKTQDFIFYRKQKNDADEGACYFDVVGQTVVYKYHVLSNQPQVSGNSLIYYAALILAGFAAFWFIFNFIREEEKHSAQEKLDLTDGESDQAKAKKYGFVFKYSQPIVKRYLVETIDRMKGIDKIKTKYTRPLAQAGLTKVITPVEFYSNKFFMVIAFPILFLIARWLFELDLTVDYAYLAALFGYVFPDLWLRSQINQRREEMFLSMPFIVDMLALSIESGLDFMAAITRVVEKAPPSALSDEFQVMLKEIKIGSSRGEALRKLSWRVDEISVNSFCATLIAADSVGASVGPVLKALSKELRNKRSTLVEKKAAQAASKIMIPMILIILPAIFLIVMAPPLMEFLR